MSRSRLERPVFRPAGLCVLALVALSAATQQKPAIPPGPMVFGAFAGEFRADGTFSIAGQGWPALVGIWKA
jgi:hypothetical protein